MAVGALLGIVTGASSLSHLPGTDGCQVHLQDNTWTSFRLLVLHMLGVAAFLTAALHLRSFSCCGAGTMVGLLAVTRSIIALGREHFLPPFLAWVNPKLKTPIFTTALLGVITGKPIVSSQDWRLSCRWASLVTAKPDFCLTSLKWKKSDVITSLHVRRASCNV